MKYFFLTLLFFNSLAVAVSDEEWDKFCNSETSAIEMKSCYTAERICERHGFETERCERVRRSVLTQNDFKSASRQKK